MIDPRKDLDAWHADKLRWGRAFLRPRVFALSFDPELRGKTRGAVYSMVEAAEATIYFKHMWLMFGFPHLGEDDSLCCAVALRRELQSVFWGHISVNLKAANYVIPRLLPILREPRRHLGSDKLRQTLTTTPLATIDPYGWEPLPEDRIARMLRSLARSSPNSNQRTQ